MEINYKLLNLLGENARYSDRELAVMLNMTEDEVKNQIAEMENAGIIRVYKAVVDWDRMDHAYVSALIELKVIPQPDSGFEDIAHRVMKFDEVETVYLMSGGYDLCVIVTGKTFQEVSMFVAKRLATMAEVTSTATHFVLRRYKELNVELCDTKSDDRGTMSL